ncbi:MAG: hypothetical protein ABIS18_03085 [Actinomycetota bacterium]
MIFALVFSILLAVWTLLPLVMRNRSAAAMDDDYEDLIETKNAIYRVMLDLEFDHKLGKVSDADELHMRRQNEAEVIEILRKLDAHQSLDQLGDSLEREIEQARRRLRSSE